MLARQVQTACAGRQLALTLLTVPTTRSWLPLSETSIRCIRLVGESAGRRGRVASASDARKPVRTVTSPNAKEANARRHIRRPSPAAAMEAASEAAPSPVEMASRVRQTTAYQKASAGPMSESAARLLLKQMESELNLSGGVGADATLPRRTATKKQPAAPPSVERPPVRQRNSKETSRSSSDAKRIVDAALAATGLDMDEALRADSKRRMGRRRASALKGSSEIDIESVSAGSGLKGAATDGDEEVVDVVHSDAEAEVAARGRSGRGGRAAPKVSGKKPTKRAPGAAASPRQAAEAAMAAAARGEVGDSEDIEGMDSSDAGEASHTSDDESQLFQFSDADSDAERPFQALTARSQADALRGIVAASVSLPVGDPIVTHLISLMDDVAKSQVSDPTIRRHFAPLSTGIPVDDSAAAIGDGEVGHETEAYVSPSTGVSLRSLDPYRGMDIPKDLFPATQKVYVEADLSGYPKYIAQRSVETIEQLRLRSAVLALQTAIGQATQSLPIGAQSIVQNRFMRSMMRMPALEAGYINTAASTAANTSLASAHANTAVASAGTATGTGSGVSPTAVSRDSMEGSVAGTALEAPLDESIREAVLASVDDDGEGELAPRSSQSASELAAVRTGQSSLSQLNRQEDAEEVAQLRTELGYDRSEHSGIAKEGPRRRGRLTEQEAAVEHAAHEARLLSLRNDPDELAKYIIAEGDKVSPFETGLAEVPEEATRKSLVPDGYKDWGAVVAAFSSNIKRVKRNEAVLKAEQTLKLSKPIRAAKLAGEEREPSRRQERVATQICRVLSSVLTRRLVSDPDLYPGGMAIEVVDVSVTSDLRTAYVRWVLPFPTSDPVVSAAAAAAEAAARAGRLVRPTLSVNLAGLSTSRKREDYGIPSPTSASCAAMISGISDRNAGDRGMRRLDSGVAGKKGTDPEDVYASKTGGRRTPAQLVKSYYGDESAVKHLTPAMRAIVASTTTAITRNSAKLKRAVGFELGMQYMPMLEFHRHVLAEQDVALEKRVRRQPMSRARDAAGGP